MRALACSTWVRVMAPAPTASCIVSLRGNASAGAARMAARAAGESTAWVIPGRNSARYGSPPCSMTLCDESGAAHSPRTGRPLVTAPGPRPKVEHTEQAMLVDAGGVHIEPKDVGVGLGTHQ